MKLTVVICTHNRSDLLISAIDSIYDALKPQNCSIIILVIANACADDTVFKLKKYTSEKNLDSLPLTYADEPRVGKSYALNHAINLVTDGYICFVDDDQILDTNYFISLLNAITDYPSTEIFCGPLLPDWKGDEPQWLHDEGRYRIYPFPIPIFDLGKESISVTQENQFPPGGQLIVHRNVFNRVGYFSENLGPTGHNLLGSEDTEFLLRAISQNEEIRYIPNIIQYHFVDKERLTLRYLVTKCFQRNRSITLAHHPNRCSVPNYQWRKLFNYMIGLIFSLSMNKTRFYLMRFSSTLGEIVGLIETK